jgi:signal transduction histidine kinase
MAPWVADGLAGFDAAAARTLLGPSKVEELSIRVDTLARSREGVVDAADAERRRIERDLHDGTQQRLVSLAMNLGMAKGALADAPEPARRAVEEAHEEAKRALTELRGFIRGLHPAVLDDRGLDAALSGIAARAPLPVDVRVTVPRRCSPTVEAVAYFVVSEALTNVARHANATRAEIVVEQSAGKLRVMVRDNGQGGASPDGGTGLRGLAQRVASVDGTLRIDSPAGGPTVVIAELPCER